MSLLKKGIRQRLGLSARAGKRNTRDQHLGRELVGLFGQGVLSAGQVGALAASATSASSVGVSSSAGAASSAGASSSAGVASSAGASSSAAPSSGPLE
eukprot:2215110-Lingulodinium_polyedra.AAC.1